MTDILLLANLILLFFAIIYISSKIDKQKTASFSGDSNMVMNEEDESAPYPLNKSQDLIKADVIKIKDGDSVIVSYLNKREEIRLSAIDCPEDGQSWGNEATEALKNLIEGRSVYLEIYENEKDSHKRTIATVYVMQGQELVNVNEKMIILGHAWVYRRFYNHLSATRRYRLNDLEKWAKSKRNGLWNTNNPMEPWKWRKQTRKQA